MNEQTISEIYSEVIGLRADIVRLSAVVESITRTPEPILLTVEQTAKILGKSQGTLNNWRHKGIGPEFKKPNGSVRYEMSAIRKYIEES